AKTPWRNNRFDERRKRHGAPQSPRDLRAPIDHTPAREGREMAIAYAGTGRVGAPHRGPITRALEDERWLAMTLLMPTVVLLGLFIAYPFFEGVYLSITNTKVGVPGTFVGLANFDKVWNDSIFRIAVYNTFLYTFVTTVFKLALGLWLALLLNRHFK